MEKLYKRTICAKNNCYDMSMKVKLPAQLGNYAKQPDRLTDKPTENGHERGSFTSKRSENGSNKDIFRLFKSLTLTEAEMGIYKRKVLGEKLAKHGAFDQEKMKVSRIENKKPR